MNLNLPPVAILAGGLATDLRPITDNIPKSLVPINNEPFIFHQLRQLASERVQRVVLCVGYRGDMVEHAVGDGGQFGLEVMYSSDQSKLMGTGGALRQALPLLGPEFFVLAGDRYLNVNYEGVLESFHECGRNAMLAVAGATRNGPACNVAVRDGLVARYEARPDPDEPGFTHFDNGLSVFRADMLLGHRLDQRFDLSQTFEKLARQGALAAYEVYDRCYDIGDHHGVREFELRMVQHGGAYLR